MTTDVLTADRLRRCARCDGEYAAGAHAEHRRTHPAHALAARRPDVAEMAQLRDEEHLSLAEIGRRHGVGRERVRQLLFLFDSETRRGSTHEADDPARPGAG